MNDYFARQNLLLRPEVGKMIKNLRLLVVGVGAAGNEVVKNLMLMGFRNITIVDFDYIEDSNLSRTVLFRTEDIGKSKAVVAAQRLKEMALAENPRIVGLHGNLMTDFGKGYLFMEHDIVISCVDTQRCRAFISDWCVRTNTPFFEIGFEAHTVNVTFFAPEDGYEQVTDGTVIDKLPSSDGFFPKPLGKFTVCLREEIGQGDFDDNRNSCSGFKMADIDLAKIPTIQSAAAMSGAIVCTELIKYLSGGDTMRNKILYYYGLTHKTLCCSYQPNEECSIHQENMPIIELAVKPGDTIGDILGKISDKWSAYPLMQVHSFVFSGYCASCGKKMEINKREDDMYDDERWCEECRSRYNDFATRLDFPNKWDKTPYEINPSSDESILMMCPQEIGIPYNDIMKVTLNTDNGSSQSYIWLHSD